MAIVISHNSSLELLRAVPPQVRLYPRVGEPLSLEQISTKPRELAGIDLRQFGVSRTPVHVLVSKDALRIKASGFVTHHFGLETMPGGLLLELAPGVYAAGPELCFIQLARTTSLVGAVVLGYELCGEYSHFSEMASGYYERPPLTSVERIGAAIEELSAQGVTFPVKVQMPYNPSTPDWDRQCQVFKQQLEGVLNDGADFIDVILTAGPADNYLSAVRRAGKYCFQLCNWGADYSDPETETDPFYQTEGGYGGRYAYLRTAVEDGIVTGETADTIMAYMAAVEEAKAITTDINARYEAFANAEAMLIENALVIPMGMSVPAYLATRLNYWEGQYASTGFSNKRLKGIHVLDHYVSMSEYEANRDAR